MSTDGFVALQLLVGFFAIGFVSGVAAALIIYKFHSRKEPEATPHREPPEKNAGLPYIRVDWWKEARKKGKFGD